MSAKAVITFFVRLSFSLLLVGAFLCAAQAGEIVTQSQLQGKVVDPNHAAVAGVKITALRNGRADYSTLTNANGEFSLREWRVFPATRARRIYPERFSGWL